MANMGRGDDATFAAWRELSSEIRFALIGLGLCSGPGDFGEVNAAVVAELQREFRPELGSVRVRLPRKVAGTRSGR